MKIAIFDSVSDQYGSSRICRLIIQALRDGGHNANSFVCIERLPEVHRYGIAFDFPLLVMAYMRKSPFRYLANLIIRTYKFWFKLPTLLADRDLLYCNTLATLPVALCGKVKGIPTVLHLHETANSRLMSFAGRHLFPIAADRIVCVSDAVAKSWQIDEHPNTRVIHNGIRDLLQHQHLSEYRQRPYDLCFVGRLTNKKGIGFFLEALDSIRNTQLSRLDRPLKVVVAGGTLPGEQMPPELESIISDAVLHMTYLGEIDDASEVFLQSKIACVPSLFHDPFPTVVLEAMRAGCTVIATALGGSREALAEAYGELVPPNDTAALAEAILRQLAEWKPTSVSHNHKIFARQFAFEQFRHRLLALDILKTNT